MFCRLQLSPAAVAYSTLCVTACAITCPAMTTPSRASHPRLPCLRNRLLRLSSVPESPSRLHRHSALTLPPPLLPRRPPAAIPGVIQHCAGAIRAQPPVYPGLTKDSLPIWFNPGIIKFQEMFCPGGSARKRFLAAIDPHTHKDPELDKLRSQLSKKATAKNK